MMLLLISHVRLKTSFPINRFASVLNEEKSTNGPGALQKAVVQSFLKNFDEAILVLDRAAGLDPSPSQFVLLGKFQNCYVLYVLSLCLNLLKLSGKTYLKARRYVEAIGKFEKALMYLVSVLF